MKEKREGAVEVTYTIDTMSKSTPRGCCTDTHHLPEASVTVTAI